MLTLHNASLLKAQCGIVGRNHATHLDPSSSALRVSDALFISLEVQYRQTEITVISRSPKKLRKTVRIDPTTLGNNDHHDHLEGSLGYPKPPTLSLNSIGSLRGDVRPDLC
ncbi:hypothetical protein CDL15_Pgr023783 [Punica granatum]|uniref:Uncharacterized protein n=1 Tax=Punica granatum TaxID=22663 RepID=A0A218WTG7_PUNGR|nr:hypothetical protein CDL15_Pgr023783 [Punica granatum]